MILMHESAILRKLSTILKVKRGSKNRGLASSTMKRKSSRRSTKTCNPSTKKQRGSISTSKARISCLIWLLPSETCKYLIIYTFICLFHLQGNKTDQQVKGWARSQSERKRHRDRHAPCLAQEVKGSGGQRWSRWNLKETDRWHHSRKGRRDCCAEEILWDTDESL